MGKQSFHVAVRCTHLSIEFITFDGAQSNYSSNMKDWRRAWQPTSVFLPGDSHGQKSLMGYSPWGRKELDTAKQLSTLT